MNKRIIAILLTTLIVLLSACSAKQPTTDEKAAPETDITTVDEKTDTTTLNPITDETTKPVEENDTTAAENTDVNGTVIIDGNTITIFDDGTGTFVDEQDMSKHPVVTCRNIGYETTLGPVLLKINSIQIANAVTTSDMVSSYLGIEKDKEYTLISLDITVENTSDDDISIYPDQSTIVTDHKEQIDCNMSGSEDVGGDYYGKVEKSGLIVFFAEKSPASEITSFNWRVSGPYDENFTRLADDITIKINIQK